MRLASSRRRVPLAPLALAFVASGRIATAEPPPTGLSPPPAPPAAAPPTAGTATPALPPAPSGASNVAPAPPVKTPALAPAPPATGVAPPGHVAPGYGPPGARPPGYGPTPGPTWAQPGPTWAQPGPTWVQPGVVPPGYRYWAPGYPSAVPAARDPYELPPPPPRRRYDVKLFAGGVVAVMGGMATVLVGTYLVSSAAGRIDIYCDSPSFPCAHKTDAPRETAGALLMAAGALAGAAGIPMWLIGAQYVTVPKDQKSARREIEVRVGPGTAGMSLRF